ncbi:hypothetical protein BDA96_10G015100 [Sorghum bicolor]|uniref:Uncharacterized protein n=1 Tax=Sorghum bicolor TaxID=4558 RepID=A0A921TXP2_SORBI|nr:hypothetical protein BDA96_10G015100 [Sorghum bicolor]
MANLRAHSTAEMANHPHARLLEHIKLARQYAREGLGDTSILFFNRAIDHINRWMDCKKAIAEEVELAKQLDAQLNSHKEAPGTRRLSSVWLHILD